MFISIKYTNILHEPPMKLTFLWLVNANPPPGTGTAPARLRNSWKTSTAPCARRSRGGRWKGPRRRRCHWASCCTARCVWVAQSRFKIGVVIGKLSYKLCFNEVYGLDNPCKTGCIIGFSASYMAQQANSMANFVVVLQFARRFVSRGSTGAGIF